MISEKNGPGGADFSNLEIEKFVRIIFFGPKFVLLAFAMGGAGNWAAHASMAKFNVWVGYIVEPWSPHGYLQEPISNFAFGFSGALVDVLAVTVLFMAWRQVWFVLLMFLAFQAFREFSLFGGLAAMLSPDFWIRSQVPLAVGAACAFLLAIVVRRAAEFVWRRWRNRQAATQPGSSQDA